MKYFIFVIFFLASSVIYGEGSVYCSETLFNFESDITKKIQANTVFTSFSINPAPIKNSTKYLSWELPNQLKKSAFLRFSPPIMLNRCDCCLEQKNSTKNYVKNISLWVYGTDIQGKLYFIMGDAKKKNHLVYVGSTFFRGWRKLTVEIPKKIFQKSFTLSNKEAIQIHKIIFSAKYHKKRDMLYLFLDDITANIRKEFRLFSEKDFLLEK